MLCCLHFTHFKDTFFSAPLFESIRNESVFITNARIRTHMDTEWRRAAQQKSNQIENLYQRFFLCGVYSKLCSLFETQSLLPDISVNRICHEFQG